MLRSRAIARVALPIKPLRARPSCCYSSLRTTRQAGPRTRRSTDRTRQAVDNLPSTAAQYDIEVPQSETGSVVPSTPLLEQPALVVTRQIEMMNVFMGYEQANRYAVMDPRGNNVGYIAEEQRGLLGGALSRQLFRTHRPFPATVMGATGETMLRIRRPFSWINSYVTVSLGEDPEAVVGEVQQQWHPWRRRYNLFLKDQNGEGFNQFAYIDGGFWTWDFYLLDQDGGLLGSINRNFVGFGREIFTDTGQYVIRMDAVDDQDPNLPPLIRGMTLEERAVMLSCAVSIDFDYFSRHSGHGGFGFLPFFGGYGEEARDASSDQDVPESDGWDWDGDYMSAKSRQALTPFSGLSRPSIPALGTGIRAYSSQARDMRSPRGTRSYSSEANTKEETSSDSSADRPYRVREQHTRRTTSKEQSKDTIDIANLPKNFGINQHIPVNDQLKEDLRMVLEQFNAPIRYAFAYGSGVFSQSGYGEKETPMVDYVFAVSHSQHWHSLNMHQHEDHYSFMRRFGSGAVSRVQDNFGARVYYNPYVKITGKNIKYGVVSVDNLCKDLLDWETLYLAGRMHKPIKILRDDARIRLANQVNLVSALRTALLLLPQSFTEEELYTTIAGLSYTGDFRMTFGENPNKVRNIVQSQLFNFNRLYSGLISSFGNVNYTGVQRLEQDANPKVRGNAVSKLPRRLHSKVMEHYRVKFSDIEDKTDLCNRIAEEEDLPKVIRAGLGEIIRKPAMTQSLKGILSAGPLRSFQYANEKIAKMKKP